MADVHIKTKKIPEEKMKEGIYRKQIMRDDSKNIQIDIIKLVPDAESPFHEHKDKEWVYILEGSMSDETGEYIAGDFIVNKKGSKHIVKVGSEGCEVLVIYSEKPY